MKICPACSANVKIIGQGGHKIRQRVKATTAGTYSIYQGLSISDFLIYTFMSTAGEMEEPAVVEAK